MSCRIGCDPLGDNAGWEADVIGQYKVPVTQPDIDIGDAAPDALGDTEAFDAWPRDPADRRQHVESIMEALLANLAHIIAIGSVLT